MRTTISIDEELLAKAREYAARKRRSLSAFIEDALREVMARRRSTRPGRKVRLKVVKGARVPGVDYDSFAALMELTETK